MARTSLGRLLTERHRQAQVRLRARFLSEFLPTWTLLDWNRLDDSAPAWSRVVASMIRRFRQESADTAVGYYRDYRVAEIPDVTEPAPIVDFVALAERQDFERDLDALIAGPARDRGDRGRPTVTRGRDADELVAVRLGEDVSPRIDWSQFDKAVEKSLQVTGPGELKRRAARGESEVQAKHGGLKVVSGSASRHVLTGARETTLTLVKADSRALGWARVTDGDPCYFCALLASRGPVYKSRASAGFQPHDACACVPEPVYSRNAAWPGDARQYQRLYYQATRGYSGKDAIRAFRRAYDKQRREEVFPWADPLIA